MKPGIKTTEFWVALALSLVGPIVTTLVGFGVFREENAAEVQGSLSTVVDSVSVIVTNIVSIVSVKTYIDARTGLKLSSQDESR